MKSTIKLLAFIILAFAITLTMSGLVYGTEDENTLDANIVSNGTTEENPLTTEDENTVTETELDENNVLIDENSTVQTLGAPLLESNSTPDFYIGDEVVASGEDYSYEFDSSLSYTPLSQEEAGYSDSYEYGLPEGIEYNNGVVSGTTNLDTETTYVMYFSVTDGTETGIGAFYLTVLPADMWADFDNMYLESGEVYNEGSASDLCTAQDGFLVYSETELDHISYNSESQTYNIVLSQDIAAGNDSNYLEILFKDSEYDKLVRWEIIEVEGMTVSNGSLEAGDTYHDEVDYYYSNEAGDDIYSSYVYVELDPEYEGNTQHVYVKASNPSKGQFRYILLSIIDKDSIFVAFESNGGSIVPTIEAEVGEVVEEPEDPTKDGYLFAGWYDDEELTTEHDFEEPLEESITLYAKWNEIISNEGIQEIDANSNPKTGDIVVLYIALFVTATIGLAIVSIKK